jgi:hypothetical protein
MLSEKPLAGMSPKPKVRRATLSSFWIFST